LAAASENLRMSSVIYRAATWYNTMAVSYANSVRDYIWGNFNVNETIPLFGSTLTVHLGLMYHSSVAWVMVFNLLVALTDNCNVNVVADDPAAAAATLGKSGTIVLVVLLVMLLVLVVLVLASALPIMICLFC
jgi:hypothetical protein